MKTTVTQAGTVLLPDLLREAANIKVGDVLEIEYGEGGKLILSHASKDEPSGRLFSFEPFPAGTLASIYEEEDPIWKDVEKAAIRAQAPPRFEE